MQGRVRDAHVVGVDMKGYRHSITTNPGQKCKQITLASSDEIEHPITEYDRRNTAVRMACTQDLSDLLKLAANDG